MLRMALDQFEFAQYDFGTTIGIKLYENDKKTEFDATNLTGVIQSFKRHGDGSFFPFKDVTRGLAVMGVGAQIISNVPITFTTIDKGIGNFKWTKALLPTVPSYMWLKALLFKPSTGEATEKISSKLVRVYVEFGAPN